MYLPAQHKLDILNKGKLVHKSDPIKVLNWKSEYDTVYKTVYEYENKYYSTVEFE